MSNLLLSSKALHAEKQFNSESINLLQKFAQQESSAKVEAEGLVPSDYALYAVRKNDRAGQEVLGPKNILVGNYSEEALYGADSSPLPHFRSAMRSLLAKSARIITLDQDDIEYSYQTTLFWVDVGKVKEFLGVSSQVSELVTELLTARFQFIGRDTPPLAIKAMADALTIAVEARRFDAAVIERVVDALEAGGIDSLALDSLRTVCE